MEVQGGLGGKRRPHLLIFLQCCSSPKEDFCSKITLKMSYSHI